MSNFSDRLKAVRKLPAAEMLTELGGLAAEAGSVEELSKLGKAISALDLPLSQVFLLGQCTLDYLAPILAAKLLQRGMACRVTTGPYDQVLQTLATRPEGLAVLFPWSEHPEPEEIGYWQACWRQAQGSNLKLLQVGYDWVGFDAYGHSQNPGRHVEALNASLRREMPPGTFFLDLAAISGLVGRTQFYDRRSYFWTKQPFSEAGLLPLAEHMAAGLQTLSTGSRKVLVVDLDNTLWGGEVGEVGWAHLGLTGPEGEAYLDFQRFLKAYQQRGVLLAIASKNDQPVVEEAFDKHPDLELRWHDFVGHKVGWFPKSQSLLALSEELRLGLDSFVFFDDNPRERAQVALALPQVKVIEVSPDPCDYVNNLRDALCFETLEVTDEDRVRSDSYRQDQARQQHQNGSVEEYLAYLDMRARIETINEGTLQRAVQLLAKTNQFNLTTRRHGASTLSTFLATTGAYVKGLRLEDRFGDLGLISVLIALPAGETLKIDTWLMSCRALQRTVEFCFLSDLVDFARRGGFGAIEGSFIATAKNSLVADLLPRCGFTEKGDGVWSLPLANPSLPASFVRPTGTGGQS